jgi:hypothetical protein
MQIKSRFDAVRDVVTRYGSGDIDVNRAAELLEPAYRDAIRVRSQRSAATNDADPDAAATPHPFVAVDIARQTGRITMEQYDALAAALVTRQEAGPS